MNRALPFNWKVPAGRALQQALNGALALDADARAGLAALEGRQVQLHMHAPPLALAVTVVNGALAVGPARGEADLAVRASLSALLGQLPPLRRDNAAPVGQLRIEGDAELARRLQKLAESFQPDWALPLTKVFGDVLGMQLANALAAALRHAKGAAQAATRNGADWLTEESRLVVGREELAAFHDEVDGLHDAVERLAARLARLGAGA